MRGNDLAPAVLALDVGGANLKAAHSDGSASTRPFALWKRPEALVDELRALTSEHPDFGRLAVTMTGETCDCFATKAEGVAAILDAVEALSDGREVAVWGTDARFHPPREMRSQPGLAASSNWLALATFAARLLPEGPALLIDVGSTTTDLIPLLDGRPVPLGRTDTGRLRSGELVYAGVRRTPVCALATELPWRGTPTGLTAELFATTLDVYLTLGAIPPDPLDRGTADGRPSTPADARDRLARMVGSDGETFLDEDALSLATAADAALTARLIDSARRALGPIGRPRSAVVSGSGAFLAKRVAEAIVEPGGPIVELARLWGPRGSDAACARALVALATEPETATPP